MSSVKKEYQNTSVWCKLNQKTIKVTEDNYDILKANGFEHYFEGEDKPTLLMCAKNEFKGDYKMKKSDIHAELDSLDLSYDKNATLGELSELILNHYDA